MTITSRKKPYWTPKTVTLSGQLEGGLMSLGMPPNWASIWSAMITEIAIVISAWRRSSPWFQRRNTCWMITPTTPMAIAPRTTGMSQPARSYSEADPVGDARLRLSPSLSSVNQPFCISKAR